MRLAVTPTLHDGTPHRLFIVLSDRGADKRAPTRQPPSDATLTHAHRDDGTRTPMSCGVDCLSSAFCDSFARSACRSGRLLVSTALTGDDTRSSSYTKSASLTVACVLICVVGGRDSLLLADASTSQCVRLTINHRRLVSSMRIFGARELGFTTFGERRHRAPTCSLACRFSSSCETPTER